MPDQPDFVLDNQNELEHLIEAVRGLTEAELLAPMDADWTVGGVLLHLAFWDRRAVLLVERWKETGAGTSPVDTDLMNDTMRPLLNAVAPHIAVELAINSARQAAEAIAGLSPDQIADLKANVPSLRMNRADHWRMHLGDIEKALGR